MKTAATSVKMSTLPAVRLQDGVLVFSGEGDGDMVVSFSDMAKPPVKVVSHGKQPR
jgi:hypothetical protein